jgi:hypothetical protein
VQPDPQAAVNFYRGVFGWQFEDRMAADAPGRYFVARLGGRDVAAVSSQPEVGPPVPVWNTYIWVENADETAALVRDAGGRVVTEPFDVVDVGRTAACADPSDAVFFLWQAGTHRGAEAVNVPGAWNWSVLNTRDLDGAKDFYGSVFGWGPTRLTWGSASRPWCGSRDTPTSSNGSIPRCGTDMRSMARHPASRIASHGCSR